LPFSNGRTGIKTYGDNPFISIGADSDAKKLILKKVFPNIGSVGITLFLYIPSIIDLYSDPFVSTGMIDEPTPLFRVEILKNGFVH